MSAASENQPCLTSPHDYYLVKQTMNAAINTHGRLIQRRIKALVAMHGYSFTQCRRDKDAAQTALTVYHNDD